MNRITLEQVRNSLREFVAQQEYAPLGSMREWADAIDAELKARGEAVAFRYMRCFPDVGFSMTDWMGVKECAAEIAEAKKQGKKIEYAYTAPPAPKIEVTDAMVERARSAFVQADDGGTGITDAMRAALEAALGTP